MFKPHPMSITRTLAVVAATVALTFTAGCNRDPNVRKQKYLESGKRFEANGKYREAAIQFSNALKVDKDFGPAHYELAKAYLQLGTPMPAYGELLRAVDLDPTNKLARIDLGNMFLAGHAPDRAAVQAKAVLAMDPNNADAYALLAGVAQAKGDNAEALKNIRQAIQLNPNQANYHGELAMLESADPAAQGNMEQELNKAASLDPKSATPHILLGEMDYKKGNMQGAEQQFLAAIGAAPKNMQAREGLAALYMHVGDKAKAEQTLENAVTDNPDEIGASKTLAEFYHGQKQMDRAESVFTDLNSKFPKSVAIKITYGQVLLDNKDYAKATPIVNQLMKSDSGNPEVQTLDALLLLNSGKTDDALTLLKNAVRDNHADFRTHLLLGQVAASKGDDPTAKTSFQEAAKLSPGSLEATSGLAAIALKHNDSPSLIELANATIAATPGFAPAYLWRGMAEAAQKEYSQAEADFQTVLKMAPDNSVAYFELGQVRLIQGHIPDGEAMLEKSLEKNPNGTRALGLLVAYDLQANQPAKAIARIQEQIAKSPTNSTFYSQLALVQLRTKDPQGALASAQKAMQLNANDVDGVQAYTQAEVALGNVDAAISVWQNWMNSHPKDPAAPQVLGSLEETKGDQAKAMDYYNKALQLDPDNGVASNNLAYMTIETHGNVDVALRLAQTARRVMPDSPQTADTLAWVYFFKGNYGAARDLLESALKTSPDDPSIHYHLGMTYTKLNDKTNAALNLKKAVTLAPDSKSGKDANDALKHLTVGF